jgi:hypothetical protein
MAVGKDEQGRTALAGVQAGVEAEAEDEAEALERDNVIVTRSVPDQLLAADLVGLAAFEGPVETTLTLGVPQMTTGRSQGPGHIHLSSLIHCQSHLYLRPIPNEDLPHSFLHQQLHRTNPRSSISCQTKFLSNHLLVLEGYLCHRLPRRTTRDLGLQT